MFQSKLIDIGQVKLETCVIGDTGELVVIETGLGSNFYDWAEVVKAISKKARVLLYHREGYGESTLSKEDKTVIRAAENLKKLLDKLGYTEPVILVPHSYGGLCSLNFAKLYPLMVKAMVLVDTTPTDAYKYEELKENLPYLRENIMITDVIKKLKGFSKKTSEELQEELKPQLMPHIMKLEEDIQARVKKLSVNPVFYKAQTSEVENMLSGGFELDHPRSIPDVPIKIIGRDREVAISRTASGDIPLEEAVALEELIQKLNNDKVNYSSKTELIYAKGSGHNIHVEAPEVVISCIEEVL